MHEDESAGSLDLLLYTAPSPHESALLCVLHSESGFANLRVCESASESVSLRASLLVHSAGAGCWRRGYARAHDEIAGSAMLLRLGAVGSSESPRVYRKFH